MRLSDLEIDDYVELRKYFIDSYEAYRKGRKKIEPFLEWLEKEILDAENDYIENGFCIECGGALEPRLVYPARGNGPFDPDSWPAEYEGQKCSECGEVYE